MISHSALAEIQDRLDIAQVIGGYLSLKRSGRNFKALCPFHPEKTPSFMVYPEKQFFICYGCGAGGDLITFIMRHEHLEFPEAVQMLAQKAGLPPPQVSGGAPKASPELYRAHEVAARFYQELLVRSPEGEAARAYLKGRGVEAATRDALGLGCAPSRWDGLVTFAAQAGLSPEILERAGLAIRREGKEGFYDRFRSRLIFPIGDSKGRVIAFGGRVIEEGANPKYLNSPETELYVKGKLLYGFHLAAPQIREKDFCIVVEGYMDLATPYQHGIRNVVASMGTSLTPHQVQLIRRLTRHVVIVYDGDYAGEMATLRGLDLFLEAQMRVKVAGLPAGLDPDSMIRTQGIQAFIRSIQGSQDLFDYKLGVLKKQWDPKELEGRLKICEELLPTIKRVPNAIERGEYVKRLGDALGVAESLLWTELGRVKLDSSWSPKGMEESTPAKTASPEEVLAGLLLEDPSQVALLGDRCPSQILKDPYVGQLVVWLRERAQQGNLPQDYRGLLRSFPRERGEWEDRFARWLAYADTIDEKERALEGVLRRIQEAQRRVTLEELKAQIQKAEASGDESATTQLILEYNRLIKAQALKTSLVAK